MIDIDIVGIGGVIDVVLLIGIGITWSVELGMVSISSSTSHHHYQMVGIGIR